MKIIIDKSKKPYQVCPSFDKCQFNDCPLAEKPNLYQTLPEDKALYNYHKCRGTKNTRMKIAKAYGLKNRGLTLKEISSMKRSIQMKQEAFSTQKNGLKMGKKGIVESKSNQLNSGGNV